MTTSECRVCAGTVVEFCDFGKQPLSNAFVRPGAPDEEYTFRLAVGACAACSMVQLLEEVPPERMFHAGYPYLSSGSAGMRRHFRDFAEHLLAVELLADEGLVVELGCNDGVMLHRIAEAGVRHLGVEPSRDVAERARARGIDVWTEFFDTDLAARIRAERGPAKVIYAANTLCHIPSAPAILDGVRDLLAPGGIFVFEDPYFADIVAQTSYDQIYDEHFFYFTATSVARMAERHGLELVDVEHLDVHGGELRYTLARTGERPIASAVGEVRAAENRTLPAGPDELRSFQAAVDTSRRELVGTLRTLHSRGARIAGYGATAKSSTVLNYCEIGPALVPFITDSTPSKQGRLTPGSHIPVCPPSQFAARAPDHTLLLAWNHADEIVANERAYRAAGGRWIRYVPRVRVS